MLTEKDLLLTKPSPLPPLLRVSLSIILHNNLVTLLGINTNVIDIMHHMVRQVRCLKRSKSENVILGETQAPNLIVAGKHNLLLQPLRSFMDKVYPIFTFRNKSLSIQGNHFIYSYSH